MALPPISETQLVVIVLFMLVGGVVVGFILGSLWMEQRSKRLPAFHADHPADARAETHDEEPAVASARSPKRYSHPA